MPSEMKIYEEIFCLIDEARLRAFHLLCSVPARRWCPPGFCKASTKALARRCLSACRCFSSQPCPDYWFLQGLQSVIMRKQERNHPSRHKRTIRYYLELSADLISTDPVVWVGYRFCARLRCPPVISALLLCSSSSRHSTNRKKTFIFTYFSYSYTLKFFLLILPLQVDFINNKCLVISLSNITLTIFFPE